MTDRKVCFFVGISRKKLSSAPQKYIHKAARKNDDLNLSMSDEGKITGLYYE
jgi:hypothetical protein